MAESNRRLSLVEPFKCYRCGYCCRNLVTESPYGLVGMFLMPGERRLFPKTNIRPYLAVGMNGPDKNIAYQYAEMVCPHITEDNRCKIYDQRPMTCRAYPLIEDARGIGLCGDCKWVQTMRHLLPFRLTKIANKSMIQGYIQIISLIRRNSIRRGWIYNLADHQWHTWEEMVKVGGGLAL